MSEDKNKNVSSEQLSKSLDIVEKIAQNPEIIKALETLGVEDNKDIIEKGSQSKTMSGEDKNGGDSSMEKMYKMCKSYMKDKMSKEDISKKVKEDMGDDYSEEDMEKAYSKAYSESEKEDGESMKKSEEKSELEKAEEELELAKSKLEALKNKETIEKSEVSATLEVRESEGLSEIITKAISSRLDPLVKDVTSLRTEVKDLHKANAILQKGGLDKIDSIEKKIEDLGNQTPVGRKTVSTSYIEKGETPNTMLDNKPKLSLSINKAQVSNMLFEKFEKAEGSKKDIYQDAIAKIESGNTNISKSIISELEKDQDIILIK